MWLKRERTTLDDVVELLRGIGTILMHIDAKLEERPFATSKEKTMTTPSPEDRDRRRRLIEEGEAARRQMQEILDRVEARMQERQARRERSFLRRLLARP